MTNEQTLDAAKEQILYDFEQEKQKHLIVSIIVDAIGMFTFQFSFLGEIADIIYAPIAGIAIFAMYRLRLASASLGGIFGFVEEILPRTDIIPTASVMWVYYYHLRRESTLQKFTDRRNREARIVQGLLDPNYQPKSNLFKRFGCLAFLLVPLLSGLYFFKPNLFQMPNLFQARSDRMSWVKEGLKGEVKSYTGRHYAPELKFGEWVAGEGEGVEGNLSRFTFDNQGRQELLVVLSPRGEAILKVKSEYEDKEDTYLETKRTAYSSNNVMAELAKYHWGDNDTIKFESYGADGKIIKRGYDVRNTKEVEDKRITEAIATVLDLDNKVRFITTSRTTYNKEGEKILLEQITNDVVKNDTTTLTYRYECSEYDDTGNCLQIVIFTGKEQKKPDLIEVRNFSYY